MPLQISVRVPSHTVSGIRDRWQQSVASARSQMVQSATEVALVEIIETVPVKTGETQAEWQSELTRIVGTLPSSGSPDTSLQAATNAVEQMLYLEYGTSQMQPRSTVRSALSRLRTQLHSLFRLTN